MSSLSFHSMSWRAIPIYFSFFTLFSIASIPNYVCLFFVFFYQRLIEKSNCVFEDSFSSNLRCIPICELKKCFWRRMEFASYSALAGTTKVRILCLYVCFGHVMDDINVISKISFTLHMEPWWIDYRPITCLNRLQHIWL